MCLFRDGTSPIHVNQHHVMPSVTTSRAAIGSLFPNPLRLRMKSVPYSLNTGASCICLDHLLVCDYTVGKLNYNEVHHIFDLFKGWELARDN
jgi:hypothetical protein